MARSLGIPRIHIAVNSGARIGLAEEVKQLFQVAWVDNADPNKVSTLCGLCYNQQNSHVFVLLPLLSVGQGIKYLYLNPVDFTQVRQA